MEKAFDKLSLYDFFGYIIPGFLGIWALSVFFNEILGVNFISMTDQGFIKSVLFLGMSYYVGVILHEISEWLQENVYKKIWKGMPSERFLMDDDSKYSLEFKLRLKEMIKIKYNLLLNNTSKTNQEAFNLMYSEIQSLGKDYKIQLFNALYGMCRNFIAGTILCIIIFLTKSLIITIKLGINQTLDNYVYVLIFVLALLLLSRRLKRFGERFTDYVIRDSYNYFVANNSHKLEGEK